MGGLELTHMNFDDQAFHAALTSRFNMDPNDAQAVTTVVADLFWGENEVNDEDLDKDTRSMFYTLQAEGILTFRRTEYKFEGATRRAFFWRLTPDALAGELEVMAHEAAVVDEAAALYEQLHADLWNRDAIVA